MSVLEPRRLARPQFLPLLRSWYVPGEDCKPVWLPPPFTSCGICQERTATGTSASFQRPFSFSEHYCTDPECRSKDPSSRKTAQKNVATHAPRHWGSSTALLCEFRGFLILVTEWSLLQHGAPHGEAQPGRGHVPRLTTRPRGTESSKAPIP